MPRRSPKARASSLTPQAIVEALTTIYGLPTWRPHGDPMTELVLTILSQNTSDTNSGRAFMRLITRFPTWEELMHAPIDEIEAEISVGGLARQKAPRIKAALQAIQDARGDLNLDFLRDMPLEDAKDWLRGLNGVGPKTAACVLMFAFGLPAIPVDTHVHRVAQRLGLVPEDMTPERAHILLEETVGPELVHPFHLLLIKHGRRLCHARAPRCSECPLMARCPAGITLST
ncbi:MAG: endonuclease III [Dehalococcoidia bacterium]